MIAGKKPPTVGPHCNEVKVSNAGNMWHWTHGEVSCPNCSKSYGLSKAFYRIRDGKRIQVDRAGLMAFAAAWNPNINPHKAFQDAVEALLLGME